MSRRVVEFDLANERVIIATMIGDRSSRRRLSLSLSPDEFGDKRHRIIFRGLQALDRGGLSWSEDTFAEICKGEDFGGFDYIRAIAKEYEPNRNVDFHLERLRLDAAKFAVMQDELPSAASMLADPKSQPMDCVRILRRAASRLERTQSSHAIGGEDLTEGYYETLRMRGILGDVIEGFGFEILDSILTRGLVPATMSALVGRPAHGKSALLSHLILHRVRSRKGIFVCGWEMEPNDYIDSIVSIVTGTLGETLLRRVRNLTDAQKDAIEKVVEHLRDRDIVEFQQNPFPKLPKTSKPWELNERNLDYFEATVERASETKSLVAVDVFSKLLSDRRPDAVNEALTRIRNMTKTYGVHIMLIHHLNRESADGPPTLEGIKGTGGWEEECDLVLACDRPLLRMKSVAEREKKVDAMDLYVLKQRKGPAPACVRYHFDGPLNGRLTNEMKRDLSMVDREERGDVA